MVLAEPWTFTLHNEERNKSLFFALRHVDQDPDWFKLSSHFAPTVTLEKGWELSVDRIYIRRGAESYNSVTFRTSYNGKKVRFWAKLNDVNKMVIE